MEQKAPGAGTKWKIDEVVRVIRPACRRSEGA